MIKRNNKKGFTIVELVIVIAVIAILAAVLIPTFAGIIRKANISADTQLVKNMNTALTADEAINGPAEDFNEVIAIVRDAGYVLSAFNPTTEGCYVVWDSESNQLLLVDSKKDFAVIYSVSDDYAEPGKTWYFAVDSKEAKEELTKKYGDTVNIEMAITDVKGLNGMLAAGGTQEIYIDESLVLDAENLLVFDKADANTTINLGSAQLNTSGTLDNVAPIQVNAGVVTINGGVIGASGSGLDLDGKVYSKPIADGANANITINDTQFNTPTDGCVMLQGTSVLNRVKANTYFYCYGNGNMTLNDCEANSSDIALWLTNTISKDGNNTYDGAATMTVNSGKYTSSVEDAGWGAVSVYGGTINIKGGDFTSKDGHMFAVLHQNGKIVITGGTFNGVDFANVKDWNALCAKGVARVSEDGKTVTITLN